jgi:hypothetical protein
MEKLELIEVACLAVDSSSLLIADPCYIEKPEFEYEKMTSLMLNSSIGVGIIENEHCELGVALAVEGDGFYPVYAVFKEDILQGYFISMSGDVEGVSNWAK